MIECVDLVDLWQVVTEFTVNSLELCVLVSFSPLSRQLVVELYLLALSA